MKNILLLGGTGFIGSNIIEHFLADDVEIILLTLKLELVKDKHKVIKNIKIVEGKLANIDLIEKIIEKYEIDTIIHLVSTLIPSSNVIDFQKELKNIITPTFHIIDLISNKNIKFVFFSSGGTVYGKSHGSPNEDHLLAPINYYGHSKVIIENYIQFKSRIGDFNYLIIRPSNVFGKYQKVKAQQGFIAIATYKILTNKSLEIWGNGNSTRDYLDVFDLVESLYQLLKKDVSNEIFNIGSGIGVTLIELITILEKELNLKASVTFKDKRNVDLDWIVLDINKLKQYIKYSPRSLNTSIQNFVKTLTEFKIEK